jgi:hypothetical protein
MKYYAIQEKATGRFVSYTDFSRVDGRPIQMFASSDRPPLLFDKSKLQKELVRRHIDPVRYEVVIVEIKVVVKS